MADGRIRLSKLRLAQASLTAVIGMIVLYVMLGRFFPAGVIERAYYLDTYIEACGLRDGVRTWQRDRNDPDGWPDLSRIDTQQSAVPCYYGPYGRSGQKPDWRPEPSKPQETSPGVMP